MESWNNLVYIFMWLSSFWRRK